MAVIVQKLDRRFTGGADFQYCLEFTYPHKDGKDFCAIREWCWETWGPSCELKFVEQRKKYVWAFITDNYRTRIYLHSKKELDWYKLRWE